jgi:hypothetical protein
MSLVRTYAVISGRLSLFLVRMYVGELPDVHFANIKWMNKEMPDVCYFSKISFG